MNGTAMLDAIKVPTLGGGRVPLGSFLKLIVQKITDHAVTSGAATLSYYFLFSLFPFLFFLVALTSYLATRAEMKLS